MRAARIASAAAICLLALAATAHARQYPAKPIRLIIAQAPGGNADTMSRAVGAKMSETLRQRIVVDNRAGASGIIATELTAFLKREIPKWAAVVKDAGLRVE
jgi:tripartite-type tricarboxylate transporter receptor subunit TctC